jgi:hypothetical protein
MRWLVLALRRLGDDAPATAGFALLVLVTALLAALAPRILASLADDAIRAEVWSAPPVARNLVLIQQRTLDSGPEDDPLAAVRAAGEELEETIPRPVRSLIERRDIVVDSGRFRVQKETTDPAFVRLRIHEGVDGHLRYLEGRPPTAALGSRDDVGPDRQDGVPVYEAAVSAATASRFGLTLGEEVPLVGDPGDPMVGRADQDQYAFVTLTGIYEVVDPDADVWLDDPQLIHPVIRSLSAEVQLLDAALVVDPRLHEALVRNVSPPVMSCGTHGGRSWTRRGSPSAPSRPPPGVPPAPGRLPVGQRLARRGHGDAHWHAAILERHQALGAARHRRGDGPPALVAVATLVLIAVLAADAVARR